MKADECVPRVVAFIKRLLQSAMINEANFSAACLLIVSEILNVRKDVKIQIFSFSANKSAKAKAMVEVAEPKSSRFKIDMAGSEDEDEEVFVDVDKL
mmetsp:Transcript_13083/g.22073  ORF Transcript_13083/g.22073 Transcript_13083/m.22073 type:complete len:97 (+) Transcript_13083:1451-1741(+)